MRSMEINDYKKSDYNQPPNILGGTRRDSPTIWRCSAAAEERLARQKGNNIQSPTRNLGALLTTRSPKTRGPISAERDKKCATNQKLLRESQQATLFEAREQTKSQRNAAKSFKLPRWALDKGPCERPWSRKPN